MKLVFMIFSLLICPAAFADGSCDQYYGFSKSEILAQYKQVNEKAAKLGSELEMLQKSGVPDDAPESIKVAVPLGESIGNLMCLCSKNEYLMETNDCKELIKVFNTSF